MENWSGRRGSNSQLSAWEADTLPLSYARLDCWHQSNVFCHEITTNFNPLSVELLSKDP